MPVLALLAVVLAESFHPSRAKPVAEQQEGQIQAGKGLQFGEPEDGRFSARVQLD